MVAHPGRCTRSMSWRACSLIVLAACAPRADDQPRLDPARLPRELRGVVPGVTTEAELGDALPDATATRDLRYGGRMHVVMSGEPAIQVQSAEVGLEAWLIRVDREVRVVSLFVRIERPCAAVVRGFGDRLRADACVESGAPRRPNQHDYCTHTPDGRYAIDLACFDPPTWDGVGHLSAWVEVIPARAREYRIAPRDARAEGAGDD